MCHFIGTVRLVLEVEVRRYTGVDTLDEPVTTTIVSRVTFAYMRCLAF